MTIILLIALYFLARTVLSESNIKIVKMEHKGMFLSPNTQLVCIVDLVKKPFNGNFQWYLNGSPIEGKSKDVDFGWWISKTEPKVYYDFIVKDPGNYTCAVTDKGQHWNATARVVKFQGISDFVLGDVSDEIKLTCPEGPPGTSAFIMVNDSHGLASKGFEKTSEDSATLKKPELINAKRPYTCQYVFTEDIATYGDRESIPKDRVINATLPVMLYKPLKKDVPPDSAKYSVAIRPSKGDVRVEICGASNNSVMPACDNGSLIIDSSVVNVTFSIYKGTELLLTGSFKGYNGDDNESTVETHPHTTAVHASRQPDVDNQVVQDEEEKGGGLQGWQILLIVVMVVAVAVAVAVAVIVLKRRKLLCFKVETQNPDPDLNDPDLNPANSTITPLMELNDKENADADGKGDQKEELKAQAEGGKGEKVGLMVNGEDAQNNTEVTIELI